MQVCRLACSSGLSHLLQSLCRLPVLPPLGATSKMPSNCSSLHFLSPTVAAQLPRFTPEGVTAIAQWGLLALIAYWVLSVLLRLLMCVVKRVFWVVKTVLTLWLFGLIVTDRTANAETTAVRVGGLVLGCVLLSLLTPDCEKKSSVDHRLSTLEGRLRAMEKRKGE